MPTEIGTISPLGAHAFKMSADRLKYLMLVVITSGILIFVYGRIDYTSPQYATWDLHDYRAMAESAPGLTQDVRQPFVFRILGPYVVGLMPFSIDTNFLVLSILLGLALPLLFYLYLSESLASPAIAASGAIFFVSNKYLYGFSSWNYFQIDDVLSEIAIVILIWAMIRQKWILFGITLFLGSLAKETPLLVVPVACVFALQAKPGFQWSRALISFVPGIAAFIFLHLALQTSHGRNLLEALLTYDQKILAAETWFRLLVNSFIPFSLIPFVFFSSTKKYFQPRKHELLFLALVVVSTFFGYNNERLMAPAFIVFYSLLVFILQNELADSRKLRWAMFLAAALAVVHHTYARYPLPRKWTISLSLFGLVAITIFSLSYKFRQSRINVRSQNSEGALE